MIPSDGSIHNLQRLLGYETQVETETGTEEIYFQLAMVQADVLEQLRLRAEGNPILKQVVDNIKVVLPLYNEEIHVYTLADHQLEGMDDILSHPGQINSGTTNSGTFMTVNALLQHMGAESLITGLDTSPLKPGLPNLRHGNFDVAFSVAGAGYDFGLNVPQGERVTLVPLSIPELTNGPDAPYVNATIRAEMYPWLKHDVETLAVRALLVTFNYDEKNPYCAEIQALTEAYLRHQPELANQSQSDPKWREFDRDAALARTDLYECARRAFETVR